MVEHSSIAKVAAAKKRCAEAVAHHRAARKDLTQAEERLRLNKSNASESDVAMNTAVLEDTKMELKSAIAQVDRLRKEVESQKKQKSNVEVEVLALRNARS